MTVDYPRAPEEDADNILWGARVVQWSEFVSRIQGDYALSGTPPAGYPIGDKAAKATFAAAYDLAVKHAHYELRVGHVDGIAPLGPDGLVRSGYLPVSSGGGSAASPVALEAIPIRAYGNSYLQTPGAARTSGAEQFQRLKGRTFAPSVTTYAKGGSRAVEVFHDVLAATAAAPSAGSTWTVGTKAFVLLDLEMNDFANYDSSGTYYHALSTAQVRQFGWALRGALAVLTARAKVESTAGTFTGTWTTSNVYTAASGGSFSFTTAAGAYVDIPVTITAADSGVAHVLLLWSNAAGAKAEIRVDGTLVQTITPTVPGWEAVYSGRAGVANPIAAGIQPVKLSGLSVGTHTIRVTHAGTAGQFLDVDCVLIQQALPLPVVYLRDPQPIAGRGSLTSGNSTTWAANKALCDPEVTAALADFPHTITVNQTSILDATALSSADGVHPNDRGMRLITQKILEAVAAAGYDPDAMYPLI